MTCSSCNAKILSRFEDIRRKTPVFPRPNLCRDLQHNAGTLWYVAAPQAIPEDAIEAKTPYGTYPVLHLHLRECVDGTLTDQVEWSGVKAGTYLEDKAFLLVTVSELRYNEDKTDSWVQMEITDKEAAAPISRLVNKGVVTVKPLGTMEAQWEYLNGGVDRAQYDDPPTEATTEAQAEQTYKTRLEKLLAALMEALR
jgi:hypothetical protein